MAAHKNRFDSDTPTNFMNRYIITITGNVQGVGYRYFTAAAASQLGINGTVCNNNDGTVQVIIESEEAAFHSLLTKLKDGPPLSKVEKLDYCIQQSSGEFTKFTIAY